jgi:hypothetical protein
MILFHLNISAAQRTVLCIVLEKDNLDRMRAGDPVTLESCNGGGLLPVPRYPEHLSILVAYLEDSTEFYEIARKNPGNPMSLLSYLEKKRQWRPEVDGTEKATNLKDFGKHPA